MHVIISDCVVNLGPEKPAVLTDAARPCPQWERPASPTFAIACTHEVVPGISSAIVRAITPGE